MLVEEAPSPGEPRGSFLAAVRGLPDNPLARREWRGLLRQSRDWRLWVGIRLPADARGWGMPSLALCCLLPYFLGFLLGVLHRVLPAQYGFLPPREMPDILAISFGLVGLYLSLITIALLAPALSRERERETWDALRSTITSPHEILVGLLVGRAGPVFATYLLVSLVWVATRSTYVPLFAPHAPFRLGYLALAVLLAELAAIGIAVAGISLAASAAHRSSGRAVLTSLTASLVLGGGVGAALWLLPQWLGLLMTIPVCLFIADRGYAGALRRLRHG